jgi:hypothetical protein
MAGSRRLPLLLLAGFGLLRASVLTAAAEPVRTVWPQAVGAGDTRFTLYQPQVDRWVEERLLGRAAVAAVRKGVKEPTYGVVWLRARTVLGRVPGEVTLEDIEFTKATFPWERDGGEELLRALRQSAGATATVPLASLNASPAVAVTSRRAAPPPPAEPPKPEPRVIHARGPAILVLVDGDYVIRPVAGSSVLRVVNTRALLLQDAATSRFYLPVGGRWLMAPAPNARWKIARRLPPGLESVRKAAAEEPGLERFDRPGSAIEDLLRAGKPPAVYVSTTPAVLSTKKETRREPPPSAPPRAHRAGGLVAGPDGNVYRPRPGGGWDKTNGRDWYPVQEPRAPRRSPERDLIAKLDAELEARGAVETRGSQKPPGRP